jgi:hypothetical protein
MNKTEMKELDKKNGGYFFSKGAMRFFNSIIETTGTDFKGKSYFITSEKFDEKSPRLYTIRCIDMKEGYVSKVSEFQEYRTKEDALEARKTLIKAYKGQ